MASRSLDIYERFANYEPNHKTLAADSRFVSAVFQEARADLSRRRKWNVRWQSLAAWCNYLMRRLRQIHNLQKMTFDRRELFFANERHLVGIACAGHDYDATNPVWAVPTVWRIAHTIYEERRWDDLPILADALEEAGCTNAELLAHLRA